LLDQQEAKQNEQYSPLFFVSAPGECSTVDLEVLIANKILHEMLLCWLRRERYRTLSRPKLPMATRRWFN
jgi:hypothetical protein